MFAVKRSGTSLVFRFRVPLFLVQSHVVDKKRVYAWRKPLIFMVPGDRIVSFRYRLVFLRVYRQTDSAKPTLRPTFYFLPRPNELASVGTFYENNLTGLFI